MQKKILNSFLILSSVFIVASCTGEEPESLKSPCVGAENSPCGDKRPANPHLMHLYKFKA